MTKKKMSKGEEMTYKNSLDNMLTSLQETWQANQRLIKDTIKELERKVITVEKRVKGVKTSLKTETSYMTKVVAKSQATRKGLQKFLDDIDPEVLDKIKRIGEIMNEGYY